jgi:hypothetical protein
MFSGIEKALVSEGGVYILPGNYTLRILRCKAGTTRKGVGFFVAEFETLASDNPERKQGCQQSWFVGLDKDAAMGNIKGFIATVEGVDPAEVDEDAVELIVSERNPLMGREVKCSANNIKTRAGGDFTLCRWMPMEPAQSQQAAAK